MDSKIKLIFYVRISKHKEDNCYCNYHNPQCNKYSDGECLVKTKLHDPYADIKDIKIDDNNTYSKVHGRTRQKRT